MIPLEITFISHSYLASSLALFMNGFLLFAVLRRTPNELRAYRLVISNIVLCDFLIAFGNLWLQPVPSSSTKEVTRPPNDSGVSYVIMGPVVYFIHPAKNHLLTCAFVGLIQYSLMAVPLSFAYRYFRICHPNFADLFTKLKTIFPVFVILILISAAATVLMWMGDMPKSGPAAEVSSWSEYYTHLDDDPNQPLFGNLIHLDYHVYYTEYIFLVMFVIGYSILIVCAMLIVRGLQHMQRNQTISSRTLRMQRRLTYCLMCQSLLPIIFGGTPIVIIAVTIGFGLYTQLVSSLSMAIWSYQQIFGPLLTMLFIPSYRYGSRRWKENASKLVNNSSHSKEAPVASKWLQKRAVIKVATITRRESQPTIATSASNHQRERASSLFPRPTSAKQLKFSAIQIK
ncbi:unnamed protein product, partial [Mesorhabditis belari]|uniref:G protein-coupled receptor n=1 Tax=Mesorhabditis belari TaxID=2138241 RepID=A0AAF3F8R8_9BILA